MHANASNGNVIPSTLFPKPEILPHKHYYMSPPTHPKFYSLEVVHSFWVTQKEAFQGRCTTLGHHEGPLTVTASGVKEPHPFLPSFNPQPKMRQKKELFQT